MRVAGIPRFDAGFLANRDAGFPHCARRGVTTAIKRELKRRAAIEPVIGHLKNDPRMDRNSLIGSYGDAANAVPAAADSDFRRLAAWARQLLRTLLPILLAHQSNPKAAPIL